MDTLKERLIAKRGKYPMTNTGVPVTDERWANYEKEFDEWFAKYEGRLSSMEASMSQPNPPNYSRANND